MHGNYQGLSLFCCFTELDCEVCSPKAIFEKNDVAIESNKRIEISEALRNEIVAAIVTLAMVHTIKPDPIEYTILAEKIVTEFSILADNWRSERSHSQVIKMEICDIYIFIYIQRATSC